MLIDVLERGEGVRGDLEVAQVHVGVEEGPDLARGEEAPRHLLVLEGVPQHVPALGRHRRVVVALEWV